MSSPAEAHRTIGAEDAEPSSSEAPGAALAIYLLLGFLFGIILIKAEIVSWFRIQEMFRLQSIHMYGIMGSGVATAALSVALLKWAGVTTLGGDPIRVTRKELGSGRRYVLGGLAFGAGWAMTGACPGPLLALIGYGVTSMIVVLAAALIGTWSYGLLRPRLPH